MTGHCTTDGLETHYLLRQPREAAATARATPASSRRPGSYRPPDTRSVGRSLLHVQ